MNRYLIFSGGFFSGICGAVLGATLFIIIGKSEIDLITYTAIGATIVSITGWLMLTRNRLIR